MPTYTIVTPSTDDGHQALPAFGSAWTGGAASITVTRTTSWGGLRFTSIPTESVARTTGIFGDPVVTSSQTAVVFRTLTLRMNLASATAVTLRVQLLSGLTQAGFANGDGPTTRAAYGTHVAEYTLPTAPFLDDVDLPLTLTSDLRMHYQRMGWDGTLAFRLLLTTAGTLLVNSTESGAGTHPTLLTTESPAHSGLAGAEWAGHGVRVDAKTGQWVPRDMAMRDGYSRRQWVHPDNYDPPDWETERRRRARSNEGRNQQERD